MISSTRNFNGTIQNKHDNKFDFKTLFTAKFYQKNWLIIVLIVAIIVAVYILYRRSRRPRTTGFEFYSEPNFGGQVYYASGNGDYVVGEGNTIGGESLNRNNLNRNEIVLPFHPASIKIPTGHTLTIKQELNSLGSQNTTNSRGGNRNRKRNLNRAGESCIDNVDCILGEECVMGVCRDASSSNECTSNSECPQGTYCDSGMCAPGCSIDNNCGPYQYCDLGLGMCVDEELPHGSCVTDLDCTIAEQCLESQCVSIEPDCTSNMDCNNSGECVEGICQCNSGHSGQFCETETCPNNCSGHGNCSSGVCTCQSSHTGSSCQYEKPNCLGGCEYVFGGNEQENPLRISCLADLYSNTCLGEDNKNILGNKIVFKIMSSV